MQELTVVGTEDEKLVLAAESGDRYSVIVDDVLRAQLRRARREHEVERRAPRPNPRDVQAHIRAGLSTEEVAALLGATVEDVARYEGPVLAEREHVVGQALAVPVLLGGDFDAEAPPTFGSAVRAKLGEAGATGERWTSWKEQGSWVVKLEFTAAEVDHDARWSFDPRRSSLAPLNADATQLSRQGSLPDGLIPRLRALDVPVKDESRFDSGAFGPRRGTAVEAEAAAPALTPPATAAVQDAAIKRAPEQSSASTETADLLEALRRRRGQREPLPGLELDENAAHAPVALFDALEPGYDEIPAEDPPAPAIPEVVRATGTSESGRRKGRSSMPSWDEIVFGARTDEP